MLAAKKVDKELESTVSRLLFLLSEERFKTWELGRELLKCYNSKIYKRRCSSFGVFCRQYIGISEKRAYTVMRVCNAFNKTEVVDHGIEKLRHLVTLSKPERRRFLILARTMSSRDLASATSGLHQIPEVGKAKGLAQGSKAAKQKRMTLRIVKAGGKIIKTGNRLFFLPPDRAVRYDITSEVERVCDC